MPAPAERRPSRVSVAEAVPTGFSVVESPPAGYFVAEPVPARPAAPAGFSQAGFSPALSWTFEPPLEPEPAVPEPERGATVSAELAPAAPAFAVLLSAALVPVGSVPP